MRFFTVALLIGVVLFVVIGSAWLLHLSRRGDLQAFAAGGTLSTGPAATVIHTKWCPSAHQQLQKVSSYLGQPDLLDTSSGGLARWNEPCLRRANFPIDTVEVRDSPHYSVHSYLNLDIPEHLVGEVRKLGNGVQYNTAQRQLVINSSCVPSAVVLMVAVKRMMTGQLRSQDAQSLVEPWTIELKRSSDKSGDLKAYLYELTKYKESLSLDYQNAVACGKYAPFS
jgi:hypothetical protein